MLHIKHWCVGWAWAKFLCLEAFGMRWWWNYSSFCQHTAFTVSPGHSYARCSFRWLLLDIFVWVLAKNRMVSSEACWVQIQQDAVMQYFEQRCVPPAHLHSILGEAVRLAEFCLGRTRYFGKTLGVLWNVEFSGCRSNVATKDNQGRQSWSSLYRGFLDVLSQWKIFKAKGILLCTYWMVMLNAAKWSP